jgi:hypothetical protein
VQFEDRKRAFRLAAAPGGAIGVPLGIELLRWASPRVCASGVARSLVLFTLTTLCGRSTAGPRAPAASADGVVGVVQEAVLGVLFENTEVARFALDSLLEGTGFEPSVPPDRCRRHINRPQAPDLSGPDIA